MSNDIDEKLDELRKEESKGNRLERDDPTSQTGFVDAIDDALGAIDRGERSDTITAFDPKLAAVLQALDDQEQMDAVFEALQAAYDGDAGLENASKSAIIRLAVRVGLQEGTESILDDLEKALHQRETTIV